MEENKKIADEEIVRLVAKITEELCEMALLLALIVGDMEQ